MLFADSLRNEGRHASDSLGFERGWDLRVFAPDNTRIGGNFQKGGLLWGEQMSSSILQGEGQRS